LIVIPTYNEIENLEALVAVVRQVVPAADLLIVDDNSPDGTGMLADTLSASDDAIHVLHRTAFRFGRETRHDRCSETA
jgi:glycosyltransferase involved in cell wall biosynthesis